MGTADFAVAPLQALVENGYNVLAVVTMPDKPAGRGHKLKASGVKVYAESQNIEVLQPDNLKEDAFVARLRELDPDLGIVVAFRMLPQIVWDLPRFGTVNLHGSLLPRYRGAAPINWAIINGDKETGVTTFRLKHEIDTGGILLQEKIPIGEDETFGEVHDRMMELGAQVMLRTVDLFLDDKEPLAMPQEDCHEHPTQAPKLFKDNCKVDWTQSAGFIHNFIRGLNPVPTAWTELAIEGHEPKPFKLYRSAVIDPADRHEGLTPGSCVIGPKRSLEVVTGDGVLKILMLQPQGKKAMAADAYLNGIAR